MLTITSYGTSIKAANGWTSNLRDYGAHVVGKKENPYTGADYDTYGCGDNGETIIDDVYALLLVPLFTYWLSIGDSLCFTTLVPYVSNV